MKYRILFLAVFFVVCVTIGYNVLKRDRKLPVLAPAHLNQELVDPALVSKKSQHKIADFKLVNQNGEFVTNEDFPAIYVADFFFTTCPTICPVMTAEMHRIYEAYKGHPSVKLLSHTVHPEVDSVETLKAYADEFDIDASQWSLVTGPKPVLYDLARKSYCVAKHDGDGGPTDFIHTENFVLIDQYRRIRGYYDGTNEADIDLLIDDIEILLNEED